MHAYEPRAIRRVRDGEEASATDLLAVEEPLEIRLNGARVVVTMRTPGDDEDLALGFLSNEGVLASPEDVEGVALHRNPVEEEGGHIVNVRAAPSRLLRVPTRRPFRATSACGVCGVESLADVSRPTAALADGPSVPRRVLTDLPRRMREAQAAFEATGGLHAAALFGADGSLVALREDVGRHNAVDKVVGVAFRDGRLPLSESILLVSGRAGFEIVQKAAAAGIPVVAAVGAPSTFATRLASASGLTLVGFLRGESFNVYARPERVVA